jgi:hypothetical protein
MVGKPPEITRSFNVPPLVSKLTFVTSAEALASKSADPPDWLAPFEGMSTAVVGDGLFTVTMIGALEV